MYNPIREGTRGGRDQFKWEDVRLMPYKERECYLGCTVKLGFLDKGGKWRKKDWWIHNNSQEEKDKIRDEVNQVQQREMLLIKKKLGLISDEQKSILGNGISQLSSYEVNDLIHKSTKDEVANFDPSEKADRISGLGFEQKISLQASLSAGQAGNQNINRLEGIDVDSFIKEQVEKEVQEYLDKHAKKKHSHKHKHHKKSSKRKDGKKTETKKKRHHHKHSHEKKEKKE